MKHVFDITSHLTFSMMRKIVEVKGIDVDECILFQIRNYNIPKEYESVFKNRIQTSYNVDVNRGRVFEGWKFWKTRQNIADFDRLIDEKLKGEDFICYVPVCSNDLCSLMVTKPNCKGYYVIEDGLASYRDYNPQTFTGVRYLIYRLLLRPLYPRIFQVKNHFIETDHPKFMGCMASSDKCFPLHRDCLTVVGMPFEPRPLDFPVDVIISVDPLYQFVSLDKADAVYRELAEYMEGKHYAHPAYKLHPRFDAANNRQNRHDYVAIMEKYFPGIRMLDASVVLESVLADSKADFYSFNSSVAIYSSQAGCRCYNMLPLLRGTSAYEEYPILKACTIPVEI